MELAETIRDGIRYTLHHDDWDTEALLRDYEECLVGYYGVYDVPSEAFERAYTATRENDDA